MSLRYIPAGLYPHVFMSEATLYAKILRKGKFRSKIDFWADPKHRFALLKLYDRDVHLVRNTAHVPDIDFDFSYNMSIFGRDNAYAANFGVREVLISAHNGIHELKSLRRHGWRPQSDKIKIFGDSGGAQMRSGTTEHVDPNQVIDWFNDQVDWGASLEIPPRPIDFGNRKVMVLLAEIQKRNNEIFTNKRRPDLKLMNVLHGFTHEDSAEWADTVKSKKFNGWAIGTDNIWSLLCGLQMLFFANEELKKYGPERFHIFGSSGKNFIPVAAWIAKFVPNLSIDSTNFLRGNRYRRYIHIDLQGKLHEVDMTPGTNKLTPQQRLPCQCPVCQTIGWWDVFKMDGSAKAQHLLTQHNLWTIQRFVKFWNEAAGNNSADDYKKLIRQVFPKTHIGITINIDYVDHVIKHGTKSARGRFRAFFQNDPVKHTMPKLFDGEGKTSNFEKMATFVGLAQKGSSMGSILKYLDVDEIHDIWRERGFKESEIKSFFRGADLKEAKKLAAKKVTDGTE